MSDNHLRMILKHEKLFSIKLHISKKKEEKIGKIKGDGRKKD